VLPRWLAARSPPALRVPLSELLDLPFVRAVFDGLDAAPAFEPPGRDAGCWPALGRLAPPGRDAGCWPALGREAEPGRDAGCVPALGRPRAWSRETRFCPPVAPLRCATAESR
jgi:hypothetical protein